MPLRNPQDLPKDGKLLAVDVGSKTLGLAMSNSTRTIASPMHTLKRTKWTQDKDILHDILKQENIVAVVVGLPLQMDGSVGGTAQAATAFAENVEKDLNYPTLLWDERLTTVAAENVMFEQRTGRQTRASKKDVKEKVDAVAASLILQGVLNALTPY